MKLRTQIQLRQAENQIDYQSQLVLLGSCFAENMGEKLNYYKFPSLQNPFGILFHPKAIEKLIEGSVQGKRYTGKDTFFHNERWHCFDAHSDLSDVSKEVLLERLNTGLKETHQQIAGSTHIIITLGTAWVYRDTKTNSLVANCHKVPQKSFSKELLPISTLTESLKNIIDLIQSINKSVSVVFTVSPVRHLKDGFVENQRSKAHLITAVAQVLSSKVELGEKHYFPAYEIMMDELRDYRFYEADMVHPSPLAIDYIWEKFKTVWISEKAYRPMEQVEDIQKGLGHKAFDPDSERHRRFLKSLGDKITYLRKEYPFMEF